MSQSGSDRDPGRVGRRVRQLRERLKISREQLATKTNMTENHIADIENGVVTRSQNATHDKLAVAFVCSIGDVTGEAPVSHIGPRSGHDRKPCEKRGLVFDSLAVFPFGFAPAVVVVGDRRENPPKTVGDLLALDSSPSELTYFCGLDLRGDTEVVSDKIFANSPQEYLRERFSSKHILAIGSPATNYLSRLLNEKAVFPFLRQEDKHGTLVKFEEDVRKAWLINKREGLKELRTGTKWKKAHEAFQTSKSGFLDPTSLGTYARGTFLLVNDDWGTVSLSPHPYRDPGDVGRLALLVGGIHLPASVHGLKTLASRIGTSKPSNEFKAYPAGGVFRVTLEDTLWEQKLATGRCSWETKPYDTYKKLSEHFEEMKSATKGSIVSNTRIDAIISFLTHLTSATTATSKKLAVL